MYLIDASAGRRDTASSLSNNSDPGLLHTSNRRLHVLGSCFEAQMAINIV
jgi:hypothetical protein